MYAMSRPCRGAGRPGIETVGTSRGRRRSGWRARPSPSPASKPTVRQLDLGSKMTWTPASCQQATSPSSPAG